MVTALQMAKIYEKVTLVISIMYLLFLAIGTFNEENNSYVQLQAVAIAVLFCRYGVFLVLMVQKKLNMLSHKKLMGFIKVSLIGLLIPMAISILTLKFDIIFEIALIYSGICLFVQKCKL